MNKLTATPTLFQVQLTKEQIDRWMPLSSTVCDPAARNCGPTALQLMNVLPRDQAEYLGNKVKITGSDIEDMKKWVTQQKDKQRLDFKKGEKLPIDQLSDVLNHELKNANVTFVFLYDIKGRGKHVATIARDLNGTFALFEGQESVAYVGNGLDEYFIKHEVGFFQCLYGYNRLKRPLNQFYEIKQTKNQYPEIKRTRKDSDAMDVVEDANESYDAMDVVEDANESSDAMDISGGKTRKLKKNKKLRKTRKPRKSRKSRKNTKKTRTRTKRS